MLNLRKVLSYGEVDTKQKFSKKVAIDKGEVSIESYAVYSYS